MTKWLADVSALTDQGETCVLISVVSTRGSVPREAGTRMVVSKESCSGTIGGGHLEYRAISIARERLSDDSGPEAWSERFPLGASLGQCCGGLVYLLFERLSSNSQPWLDFVRANFSRKRPVVMITQLLNDSQTPGVISSIKRVVVSELESIGDLVDVKQAAIEHARRILVANDGETVKIIAACSIPANSPSNVTFASSNSTASNVPLLFETLAADSFDIYVFGAGHVGQAIVTVLSGLPCRIQWIDSRSDLFPATLPANVQTVVTDQPDFEVDGVRPGSYVLIMTHSHVLDEAICERALQRDDLAYCGLIGSVAKKRKFIQRFQSRGMPAKSIEGLTCPIGLQGLSGKHPSEIAIAVSAQLLLVRASATVTAADDASVYSPALQ